MRSLAATLFMAASPAARRSMLADRFTPMLDADPELAAALLNALPSAAARTAFEVLIAEYRREAGAQKVAR